MSHSTEDAGSKEAATAAEDFTVVRPKNADFALGLAVKFLMMEPVYANQKFGNFAQTLYGAIDRGHFIFALKDNILRGFTCWGHSDQEQAEAWAHGREELPGDGSSGDCMVILIWHSRMKGVNQFMRDQLREHHLPNTTKYYFRRIYPDGRIRPVELRLRKKSD